MYSPDEWTLIKIITENEPVFYKVFAVWRGGYLDGDSWKTNSGITHVTEDTNFFYFHGLSGSIYKCGKTNRGIKGVFGHNVLQKFLREDGVEEISRKVDVTTIHYNLLQED